MNEILDHSALVVIDVQNDFCSGGTLPVPNGDQVIEPLNKAIRLFQSKQAPIFFSRDWHPMTHQSFKSQGGPWPAHCVQDTHGAEFHPALEIPKHSIILSTGFLAAKEGYSAFEETHFEEILREKNIQNLYLGGLATEYCVKSTAMEALKKGFHVLLIKEAIQGIESQIGDTELALAEMKQAGAQLIEFPQ